VAIIGADAPTLPRSMLSHGLLATRDADVALGPALDGGYYLVAIRSEAWPRADRIFQEIPWSTERVLERTLERAREAGLEAAILEAWYDIDEYEDVIRAARDVADGALARLFARGGFLPPG
jgi:uncharacterized protein